ncbi:MAG TPA: GNAT family N-acetyltransferase [bacterium]|nr:GNAT family N-acetyltransferase [bacterium]
MRTRTGAKKEAQRDYHAAFQAVQAILLKHWNPLGIKAKPGALNGYEPYVSQVVFLAKTGASAADIAGHLAHLESTQLALPKKAPGRPARCKKSGRAVTDHFTELNLRPIEIRRATLKDRKIWAAMRFELWPEAGLKNLSAEVPALLKRRRFHAWIAMDGGLPMGFAEAFVREFANGCERQPVAFLEGIWVQKSHRRKGVGRALLKHVEAWALRQGLKELGSDAYVGDRLSHRSHLGWGFDETEKVVYFRKKLG